MFHNKPSLSSTNINSCITESKDSDSGTDGLNQVGSCINNTDFVNKQVELMNNIISDKLSSFKTDLLSSVNTAIESKLANSIINDKPSTITSSQQKDPPVNLTWANRVEINKQPSMINSNMPTDKSPLNSSQSSEHVLVLTTEKNGIDFASVKHAITDKLVNIPVMFLNMKDKSGKIIIGFPSLGHKETAKAQLSTCQGIQSNGFLINEAKKMLPKVTVTNIPNYLVSHILKSQSIIEYRDNLKHCLHDLIMLKNAPLCDLLSSNDSTFEMIYVNVGKKTILHWE